VPRVRKPVWHRLRPWGKGVNWIAASGSAAAFC
jgi:hypothetical protein